MAQVVRTETRRRGFFGKLVMIAFWAFNAIMLLSFIAGLGGAGGAMDAMPTEAERAGAAVGTMIGAGMILSIWLFGALILGLMAFFTRGQKVVTETTQD